MNVLDGTEEREKVDVGWSAILTSNGSMEDCTDKSTDRHRKVDREVERWISR